MHFDWLLEILLFQIDWVEYFNTMFGGTVDHVFTEDDTIIMATLEYFLISLRFWITLLKSKLSCDVM